MKALRLTTAIGTLCAGWLIAPGLQAQEAAISITSRTDNPAPKIVLRSRYDFEKSISLKVRTDPRLLPSDVLIKTVSEIGMTDANGVRIVSGFDIDVKNDLVVAFSGGSSEIIRTTRTPQGLQIITSFKDKGGNFVSPPVDSLALYSIGGKKLCFDYKEITSAAPKMAFTLLLDRSGSMSSVLSDVQRSADEFLNGLPSTAECAVASFNSGYEYHNEIYQNCNTGDFKLDSISAGGGTDLYNPLLSAYENLDQAYFDNYQKAVIVLTDGQISPDDTLKKKVQAVKKNTLTFVYFLGNREDRYLTGLADAFLHSTSNISQNLTQYFHSLSAAYRTQKVLSVKKCSGGTHANP
ncbi:MAG: vWA domain-containing protein [Candidatus Thiodiazotropha endolucinida]